MRTSLTHPRLVKGAAFAMRSNLTNKVRWTQYLLLPRLVDLTLVIQKFQHE